MIGDLGRVNEESRAVADGEAEPIRGYWQGARDGE